MPSPIKVALVGYGLAGKVFHAPLIAATPGLELAAVVTSDPAKVHADWPHVVVLPDLDAALADPAIALLVLATPDALHAPQAEAAIAAGKHVVIDKPFAPQLAAARAVAALGAKAGRMVSIFHNRRWDGDFLTLQALVRAGDLGDLVQFESHFDRFRPGQGERWKDNRAGGVWQDLGPHLIDQALVLLGRPQAVSADIAALKPAGSAADHAHVVLHYPSARAILHITQSAPDHGLRYTVHGTRGSYIKHGIDPQEDQSKAGMRPADPEFGVDPVMGLLTRVEAGVPLPAEPVPTLRGSYTAYYAAIRAALADGAPPPVTSAEAMAVMEVLEAGLESARTGARITL